MFSSTCELLVKRSVIILCDSLCGGSVTAGLDGHIAGRVRSTATLPTDSCARPLGARPLTASPHRRTSGPGCSPALKREKLSALESRPTCSCLPEAKPLSLSTDSVRPTGMSSRHWLVLRANPARVHSYPSCARGAWRTWAVDRASRADVRRPRRRRRHGRRGRAPGPRLLKYWTQDGDGTGATNPTGQTQADPDIRQEIGLKVERRQSCLAWRVRGIQEGRRSAHGAASTSRRHAHHNDGAGGD